jgi:TRAP transporter TAXI family solute receptor
MHLMRLARRAAVLRSICAIGACTALISCDGRPAAVERQRTVVHLAANMAGSGGFSPIVRDLAKAYKQVLPHIDVAVDPMMETMTIVQAIQRGDAEMALALADTAYLAFVGQLDGTEAPLDQLRAIGTLQLPVIHIVVGPSRAIRQVSDLSGRRIAVTPPVGAKEVTAKFILDAFGVDPKTVRIETIESGEAVRMLIDGSLDAIFLRTIFPAEMVTTAVQAGARILPLTGDAVDTLRREYPFLRGAVIPPDVYPGVSEAIHTIGVDSLLICRKDLSETLVYDLTRGLFEALPVLAATHAAVRTLELDQAAAAPIPLHEGAARYYRERELLR